MEEKSFLAVLQLPLLSSAAFPSLPSLSPTPALKLQHPLSVSDAEAPRLTQRRWDGGRWRRQAGRVTAKCSMWKGKTKEWPQRGGLPCAGKSRHQSFCLNLCLWANLSRLDPEVSALLPKAPKAAEQLCCLSFPSAFLCALKGRGLREKMRLQEAVGQTAQQSVRTARSVAHHGPGHTSPAPQR